MSLMEERTDMTRSSHTTEQDSASKRWGFRHPLQLATALEPEPHPPRGPKHLGTNGHPAATAATLEGRQVTSQKWWLRADEQ